ncbi:hypothetical protein MUP46_03245 [Patescibacteria group bacterium]|nr:hypothetical protein [Patescibacteria group bacterium]
MSEPGAEIPKPAWMQREQARLEPKHVEHGVKTGPLKRTPTYQEQVAARAAQQRLESTAPTKPFTTEQTALKQTAEQAQQIQERLKKTRSLKDIVEGR